MAALTPGSRWASRVCTTEVIVVKGPGTDVDLTCGGAAMVAPGGAPTGAPDPAAADGTQLGKRYVDADETVDSCTHPLLSSPARSPTEPQLLRKVDSFTR